MIKLFASLEGEKLSIRNLKVGVILFFLFPIILIILGKSFILNNYVPFIKDYEKEEIKFLMNFLYFVGLGVFFFCNGFSDFISKKLFVNKNQLDEKIKAYYIYTLIMLSFLSLISISGLIGFLICGNFAWLSTFSLINFLTLFSYFPTERRFKKKLETFSS
ncbi:MAG: hypothetical protein NC833_01105 [Candidatus Omnitrophica bacterium]|nr:hypothetical protein [Candidatus Omnitrophota bacterium]